MSRLNFCYYTMTSLVNTYPQTPCFPKKCAILLPLINLIHLRMAKMTKSQMLANLSEKWGVSKKEAGEMLDKFVEMVYSEVKGSGEFSFPGLGKLIKKHRDARMGRNPATGASIQIPAKTVLKFRVAKAAKDALL
ncbi:MAG: HU-beta DNA-binding protein [Parcubacteria group bacterium GW2011_GWA2_53_21]|nr:MAG: HU-beta DNA-binding protein [Parcubacteria group bacterium GW2011_GWA2_53_21]